MMTGSGDLGRPRCRRPLGAGDPSALDWARRRSSSRGTAPAHGLRRRGRCGGPRSRRVAWPWPAWPGCERDALSVARRPSPGAGRRSGPPDAGPCQSPSRDLDLAETASSTSFAISAGQEILGQPVDRRRGRADRAASAERGVAPVASQAGGRCVVGHRSDLLAGRRLVAATRPGRGDAATAGAGSIRSRSDRQVPRLFTGGATAVPFDRSVRLRGRGSAGNAPRAARRSASGVSAVELGRR